MMFLAHTPNPPMRPLVSVIPGAVAGRVGFLRKAMDLFQMVMGVTRF